MKKAFTLAEVLITLGIIGVVAAMTLPAMIQKKQKKEVIVSLQKMYSTLMQAAESYQAANGIYITEFDTSLSAEDFMKRYFNPYLNISAHCKNVSECWKGGRIPKAVDGNTNFTIMYGLILSNGCILGVNKVAGGVIFYFDVDGYRGHNRSGHDIFNFFLINTTALGVHEGCQGVMKTLKSGIYPGGYASCYKPYTEFSREELLGTTIHRGCNKNASTVTTLAGDACAALIMQDGWEIKDDYPW